jgi:hypothetical protein
MLRGSRFVKLWFIPAVLALPPFGACAQEFKPVLSGEVTQGENFRAEIGSGLVLVLTAAEDGWTIGVVPKIPCEQGNDYASAALNVPIRGYNALSLDTSYGKSAEEAVAFNPRRFWYVTNCADYKRESHRMVVSLRSYGYPEGEANAIIGKPGGAQGRARLVILDSKIDAEGRIQWLRFRLDRAPPRRHKGLVDP